MAGNLHMRNLDDGLIARLKRREVRHGRSTEAEHREILRQTLIGDIEPCANNRKNRRSSGGIGSWTGSSGATASNMRPAAIWWTRPAGRGR